MCSEHRVPGCRRGVTLIEVTIAVMVFAAAMLPVLMLTTQTTKRTVSLEKHLVAAEFASGVLDRLLAMGFEECRQTITRESGARTVLDDPAMKGLGSGDGAGSTFQDGLRKSFQEFTFEVTMTEPGKREDQGQMFTIAVEVRWPAEPKSRTLRNYLLQAVKFNENP